MRLFQFLLLAVIQGCCALFAVDSDHPVEIATAGPYDINITLEVPGFDTTIDLLTVILDGSVISTRRNISNRSMTGDGNFNPGPRIYRFEKIPFTAGPHTISVHTENVDDFNPTVELPVQVVKLTVIPAVTVQAPFGKGRHTIPGRIEAENYDIGGVGLAYDRISWEPLNQISRQDNIGLYGNQDIEFGSNQSLVHLDTALQHPFLYDQWEDLPELFAPAWVEYTVICEVEGNLDVGISGQVRDFSVPLRQMATQRVQLSVDGVTMPDVATFNFTTQNHLTGGTFRNVPFTLGTHILRFTVLPPPAGSSPSDPTFTPFGVNFDAIVVSTPPMPPVDLVMENDDPGVTLQGRWFPTTLIAGFHGPDYLYAVGMPHRDERAIYRPTLTATGIYEVSIWYPARDVRSAAVPVTVTTYNQTRQVVIDQRSRGGQWVILGQWTLLAGHSTSVIIETGRQNGITVADAVRFRQVGDAFVYPADAGDVVIDDADPQRVDFTGTWSPSHAVSGFLGSGYRYAAPGSPAPTTATFTPYLPITGFYEVIIGSPAYGGRSPATPVTIRHRDGETTLTIDQRNGNEHVLGLWMFNAGDLGSVTIGGAGSPGYVIADSVRFRPISAPQYGNPIEVPATVDGAEFDASSQDVRIAWTSPLWAESSLETLYSIEVVSEGTYDISVPYHKDQESIFNDTINEMAILIDGVRVSERLYAPNWQILRADKIHLTVGTHLLTVFSREADGPSPQGVNTMIRSVDVARSREQTPFHEEPIVIPGLIQAEDYDFGGKGLAYNRTAWVPVYQSHYRLDSVGITTSDFPTFSAFAHLSAATVNPAAFSEVPDPIIGLPAQGFEPAWMEYTILSASADTYDVTLRVRVPDPLWNTAFQRVQLSLDGVTVSDPLIIPWTGDALTDAIVPRVPLPAGQHRLRVTLLPPPDGSYEDGTGSFPWGIDIDSLEITPSSSPLSKG